MVCKFKSIILDICSGDQSILIYFIIMFFNFVSNLKLDFLDVYIRFATETLWAFIAL